MTAWPPAVDAGVFRDVIGRFAAGVSVITATDGATGFVTTASALTSLSLEPPMLLLCLNRSSATQVVVDDTGRFGVSILGRQQEEIARRCAGKGTAKYDPGLMEIGESGIPFLRGALAHLECRVHEIAYGGTHVVFLAHVDRALAHEGEPLVYYRGRFGAFAGS
jgi:flavin reductase (DIM6/NTAB) family NADH-FMN oxidoreductase RutF